MVIVENRPFSPNNDEKFETKWSSEILKSPYLKEY